ncbi:N-acetylmuramoyl-L-alanine amidase [Lysinibacillus halotolerans]
MTKLWIEDLIPKNKWSRPGYKMIGIRGIVKHYTANPGAGAKSHVTYFGKTLLEQNKKLPAKKQRFAGAHILIDKNEARLLVPLDEVCYHANEKSCKVKKLKAAINIGGKTRQWDANLTTIGVELCIEEDGSLHPDTLDRAQKIDAYLLNLFNLTENDIYRHYDVTGKNCPVFWVSNPQGFVDFKNAVKVIRSKGDVEKDGTIGSGTIVSDNELVNDEKVTKPIQPSKPSTTTKKEKLVEDGYWGPATTKALQRHYGTTVDGVISGQPKNATTKNIPSVHFGKGGSQLIRALQKDLGTTVDGVISCPSQMIKALQKRLGTIQDGKVSYPSLMVKAMQKALNNGRF